MQIWNRTLVMARRSLALTALLAMGVAGAQTPLVGPSDTPVKLNLNVPAETDGRDAMFSSSSANNEVAVAENHFDFLGALANTQPPPRRGYGRPRYRGGNTNPDGSSKYAFLVGGGYTQPLGNTYHYLTPSWGFQAGGGRNFNKNVAIIGQFDWDNFGFTRRVLDGQTFVYNSPNVFGTGAVSQLDGSSNVWSITVNPTFNLYSGEGFGAYVVVGAGFYHKTANFTVPATATYCDFYYGCYQYPANQSIDRYTSNAPGFNGGFGLTYKISRFSSQRLYGEVRYVFVNNQQRPGFTVNNTGSITATSTNLFPANSNRTTYFPVKFGLRF